MNKKPWMILTPITLWMVLFFVLPFLLVVLVSFWTRGTYGGIEYIWTLANYIRFIDPLYVEILSTSVIVACVTTITCLLLGYPFAFLLAKAPKHYQTMLLLLVIIPFWTNSLIRTYAWIILLRTEGVINSLLLSWGIIQQPLEMLYHNGAVIIGLIYTLFPFMVLPLYASIEKLGLQYLEAAQDLGAGPWRSFWHVTLPLTAPGTVAGCLLVFIPTLGLFFIPDLMGGAKTMLIGNLIKNQFLTARDWPFGAASSVILMMFTLVFIWLYLRISKGKQDTEVL